MKLNTLLSIFLLLSLFGCVKKDNLTLSDFIEINAIERVKMSNNSGTFYLTDQQLISFIKDVKKLSYEPNFKAKVGAISIELSIAGKTHTLTSATHGECIEVHSSIATKNQEAIQPNSFLYFKTNNVNFDNYTKL